MFFLVVVGGVWEVEGREPGSEVRGRLVVLVATKKKKMSKFRPWRPWRAPNALQTREWGSPDSTIIRGVPPRVRGRA